MKWSAGMVCRMQNGMPRQCMRMARITCDYSTVSDSPNQPYGYQLVSTQVLLLDFYHILTLRIILHCRSRTPSQPKAPETVDRSTEEHSKNTLSSSASDSARSSSTVTSSSGHGTVLSVLEIASNYLSDACNTGRTVIH